MSHFQTVSLEMSLQSHLPQIQVNYFILFYIYKKTFETESAFEVMNSVISPLGKGKINKNGIAAHYPVK